MAFMPTWQYLLPNPTRKRVGLLTLLPTIDSVSDVSRVTRGLAIRRAKKRVNLTNDKRKMCSQRFDSHEYRRLQFLRAVSHAVGSEKMLSERHLNSWLSMGLTPTFSTHAVCSRIFHSCIFHPCNYAGAAFSTPAFSVAPSWQHLWYGVKFEQELLIADGDILLWLPRFGMIMW